MSISSFQRYKGDVLLEKRDETREVTFQIDEWTVIINQNIRREYVNGRQESQKTAGLNITLFKDDYHLKGYLEFDDKRSYRPRFWWKINPVKRRQYDPAKISDLLDKVWAFWQSPECQRMMLKQTIEKLKAK